MARGAISDVEVTRLRKGDKILKLRGVAKNAFIPNIHLMLRSPIVLVCHTLIFFIQFDLFLHLTVAQEVCGSNLSDETKFLFISIIPCERSK